MQVKIIYDGDCPICSSFVRFYKIKEAVRDLEIINARDKENKIIGEINLLGFNLDSGFVVKVDDRFYHGVDASNVLALMGSNSGIFNRVNVFIFSSKTLCTAFYPLLRAGRNFALWLKGKNQINNLIIDKSIFWEAFKKWDELPTVIQKRFANRPFSNDIIICEGTMDISFGKIFKFLSPLLSFLKLLIPKEGKNISARVMMRSDPHANYLNFEREFFFPGKTEKFVSRLIPVKQNEFMERLNYGICWRFLYSFENNLVLMKHKGYALRIFKFFIPIPLTLLFGAGYAEEEALFDNEFRMKMTITHFLFGEIYCYQGNFKIK
jgi:predicted DCC family thiol-disulfide oxidoreductase YuxK